MKEKYKCELSRIKLENKYNHMSGMRLILVLTRLIHQCIILYYFRIYRIFPNIITGWNYKLQVLQFYERLSREKLCKICIVHYRYGMMYKWRQNFPLLPIKFFGIAYDESFWIYFRHLIFFIHSIPVVWG